ncbi:hypothetical protein HK101_004311 [Irineochytrium annulatum]|nr:hypothetical protein HK101_004311 [Irineochytrium annulatum]
MLTLASLRPAARPRGGSQLLVLPAVRPSSIFPTRGTVSFATEASESNRDTSPTASHLPPPILLKYYLDTGEAPARTWRLYSRLRSERSLPPLSTADHNQLMNLILTGQVHRTPQAQRDAVVEQMEDVPRPNTESIMLILTAAANVGDVETMRTVLEQAWREGTVERNDLEVSKVAMACFATAGDVEKAEELFEAIKARHAGFLRETTEEWQIRMDKQRREKQQKIEARDRMLLQFLEEERRLKGVKDGKEAAEEGKDAKAKADDGDAQVLTKGVEAKAAKGLGGGLEAKATKKVAAEDKVWDAFMASLIASPLTYRKRPPPAKDMPKSLFKRRQKEKPRLEKGEMLKAYNTLLQAYARGGHQKACEGVLNEMIKAREDRKAFDVEWEKKMAEPETVEVLRERKKMKDQRRKKPNVIPSPDAESYLAVIDVALRTKSWDRVMELDAQALAAGLPWSSARHNKVLKAAIDKVEAAMADAGGDVEEAAEFALRCLDSYKTSAEEAAQAARTAGREVKLDATTLRHFVRIYALNKRTMDCWAAFVSVVGPKGPSASAMDLAVDVARATGPLVDDSGRGGYEVQVWDKFVEAAGLESGSAEMYRFGAIGYAGVGDLTAATALLTAFDGVAADSAGRESTYDAVLSGLIRYANGVMKEGDKTVPNGPLEFYERLGREGMMPRRRTIEELMALVLRMDVPVNEVEVYVEAFLLKMRAAGMKGSEAMRTMMENSGIGRDSRAFSVFDELMKPQDGTAREDE